MNIVVCISSVPDTTAKINFVDNEFLSIDALKFRAHLAEMTPDVNMVYSQTISDGSEEEMTVPMTVQFFWPAS